MSDRPTELEYKRAESSGEQARRNGGRLGDCPYKGSNTRVIVLAEAWANGWSRVDASRKAGAR